MTRAGTSLITDDVGIVARQDKLDSGGEHRDSIDETSVTALNAPGPGEGADTRLGGTTFDSSCSGGIMSIGDGVVPERPSAMTQDVGLLKGGKRSSSGVGICGSVHSFCVSIL